MNTRHCHYPFRAASLGLLVVLVASCGGGGVGDIASGGIGGTGITSGSVTGFGSVIVNARIHETDNSTEFLRNGNASMQEELRVGDVVLIEWETTDLTRKARRVVYQRALYGEVTQAPNPVTGTVEVVGQTVTVNGATLFDNFASSAAAGAIFPPDLDVGTCVEISGLRDAAGNLLVTRIERVAPPCSTQTEIQGVVTVGGLPTQITVSGTTVDVPAEVEIVPAPVALTNGAFVTIQGSYGNGVLTARVIHVRMDAFTERDGDEADIEGLISGLSVNGSTAVFTVSGVPVSATDAIEYENGSFAVLADNVRIEVEGVFANGVLVAEEIELKLDDQIEMESILLSADADNGRLTLDFGPDVVVVATDPSITRFRNDTDTPGLALADLHQGDYVKIVGFVASPTSSTEPVANLVELDRVAGSSDDDIDDRVLQGPVTDVSDRPDSFSVLGVRISTSSLTECEDAFDETIDCSVLVDRLSPGDIVEVQGSSRSAGGWVDWDELELDD